MALVDKCIAQWLFDNNGLDSIGLNHATAFGPTYSSSVKKLGTHSALFDGLNDYFIADYPATLDLKNDFTIDAWAWADAGIGSSAYTILNWGEQPYAGGGTRRSIVIFQKKAMFSGGGAAANLQDPNLIPLAQWVHVAVSVSSSNFVKLYVNGVLVAGATKTLNSFAYSQNYIGRSEQGSGEEWDGYIDTPRIFDSVLTDGGISVGQTATGEIGEIYNSGNGLVIGLGGLSAERRKLGGFGMVF